MKRVGWRQAVAIAVAVGSVSGCGQLRSRSSESESTSAASTTDGSTATDETAVTESPASASVEVSVAPPTVPDTTLPETTVPETTAPEPTVPVDPCADFEALLGYQRMMAVKEGTAPTDPACKPAVDRSTLAFNTYETSLRFSEQLTNGPRDDLMQATRCEDPVRFSNPFDAPILYWGVSTIIIGDELVSYQPQSTAVIPPGGSTTLVIPGGPSQGEFQCGVRFVPILAPAGGLAAGIDAAPVPADDPQASDDPQLWGLALLEPDTYNFGMGQFVNRIEDIHSADVGAHFLGLESGGFEPRAEQPTYTVCASEPADLGPDVAGEYAWLMYASQTTSEQYHGVGLFSRGVDRRWRFLGTTQVIDEVVDPADPCTLPPKSS